MELQLFCKVGFYCLFLQFSSVCFRFALLVWSLNAKFELDRDKVDKSAKLCIQFPWDMSIKSEVGAQGKSFLLAYKMGNTFHHRAAVLGNLAFFLK